MPGRAIRSGALRQTAQLMTPEPPAAGVTVEQVRTAARTTTGTQDFTVSGFGTVKAAIIEVTLAVADDAPIARAFYSYGIVDGTSQYCASIVLEDNVSPAWNNGAETGSDQAYTSNNKCVALLDCSTPALLAVATFNSFITDGVRINWTTAPSTAVLVKVTLLGGSSLSVYAGDFTSTSVVDTATTISSVPFLADNVILVGNHRTAFNSFAWPHAVPNSAISIGFADRGVTVRQCCLAQYGDCSQPLSETAGQVSSLYAAYGVLTSQGIEITDFTSSGFSAYTRESADFGGGFKFFYLALNYDDQPHWVGVVDSPTATGNISETSSGIHPIAFMQLCSGINLVNVPRSQNGVGAGAFGSVTCTANDLITHGFSGAHGVNPQDTESWTSDTLRSRLSTQSDLHIASFVSFDTSGYTLNYSTANATVRKWPTLVIGTDESPDSYGERDITWTTDSTVHRASVSPIFGNEHLTVYQMTPETTHVVRMRYLSTLAPKYRLLIDETRTFEVIAILNTDTYNHEMIVACKELEVETTTVHDTATIYPTKDAYLDQGSPTANRDTLGIRIGRFVGGTVWRGVFHFDLSSDVPAGAVIDSATLYMSTSSTQGTGAACKAHRLTVTDWVENEVTWRRASTALDWTDGGDYTETGAIDWTMNADVGVDSQTVDLTSLAQDAVDSRSLQLHVLLKDDAELTNSTHRFFKDVENDTEAERPRLELAFSYVE